MNHNNQQKNGPPILWIVTPCYNEEKTLSETIPRFLSELKRLKRSKRVSESSKLCFINDGSTDKTWEVIKRYSEYPEITGICLSRNFGQQNALFAGYMEAKKHCDIAISLDCDGQDDISIMKDMIDLHHEKGYEIVYAARDDRKTDTWFKRKSAGMFYRTMRHFDIEMVENHAEYRLVSKRVLDLLPLYQDQSLFLRNIFPLMGFESGVVKYSRQSRNKGESHYPVKKMVKLAANGIVGYSAKPILYIALLGLISFILGVIGLIQIMVMSLKHYTIDGWAVATFIAFLLSGIQMIGLSVIGLYLWHTCKEVKKRPNYIVSKYVNNNEEIMENVTQST